MRVLATAVVVCAMAFATVVQAQQKKDDGAVQWTSNGAPTEAMITGGPWTLEQSGAANGLKSSGYCDAKGNPINNPGTERMEPYYFPFVVGHGKHVQGYFDWRPKDIEEGVVAAHSDDAGFTWTFQQKVLDLNLEPTRKLCPDQVQKDPDGDKDNGPDPNNSDNGDDDGQGHQFVIHVNGQTLLYTLVRSVNHIDQDGLAVHVLNPAPGLPLSGAPDVDDAQTDSNNSSPVPPVETIGLLNPDGILGVVPGSKPLTIIYEQKILKGDNTGSTALPVSQQCATFWSDFYKNNGGLSPNDDITYLRLASTTDGVHFTDLGALQGLSDPTTVSAIGTRWLATAGTIIRREDGRWGLLFSGGNCVDADSDAFHYIGYAESDDLRNWTVINGINNPVASVAPFTLTVGANGAPTTSGVTTNVMVPANPPVVGHTLGWFEGRVYAPSAIRFDERDITVIFAGYHTQKPKNGLGDYRTIGRFSLHSSRDLAIVGADAHDGDRDDE